MLAGLAVLVFPVAMLAAAASDVATMTIPNRLQFALAAGFCLAAAAVGMPVATLGLHVAAGALALLVCFGCFAAGWMGGGDAKLIAATALWLGPTPLLFHYLVAAAFYGGVLTLLVLGARALVAPATGVVFLDRLLGRAVGVPYGVALGVAGLVAFAESPWAAPVRAYF